MVWSVADLTYGKSDWVALALVRLSSTGKAAYMDGSDGGMWNYGDKPFLR